MRKKGHFDTDKPNKDMATTEDVHLRNGTEPLGYNGISFDTLNSQQKDFCIEYAISRNARHASRSVGYHERNGYQLLQRADVQAYVEWLIWANRSSRIATMNEVLERLTSIARGDDTEQTVTNSGKLVDKELFAKDKLSALKLLGEHYGAFKQVVELEQDTVIKIDLMEDEEFEESDEMD